MGKIKKIVIIVFVLVLLYFVSVYFDGAITTQKELQNLSEEELKTLSVDWNYKDLLRNIDDYDGKIIYVEGWVGNSQPEYDSITLCITEFCDDQMFVLTEQNYLKDDRVSGYLKVFGLEVAEDKTNPFGGIIKGTAKPSTGAIKLTCTNC